MAPRHRGPCWHRSLSYFFSKGMNTHNPPSICDHVHRHNCGQILKGMALPASYFINEVPHACQLTTTLHDLRMQPLWFKSWHTALSPCCCSRFSNCTTRPGCTLPAEGGRYRYSTLFPERPPLFGRGSSCKLLCKSSSSAHNGNKKLGNKVELAGFGPTTVTVSQPGDEALGPLFGPQCFVDKVVLVPWEENRKAMSVKNASPH